MQLTSYRLSGYEGYFVKGDGSTHVCDNSCYQLEFKAKGDASAIRRSLARVRTFARTFEGADWYKFEVALHRKDSKDESPLLKASVIKNLKRKP
ncbi:MAG: hypothetical protein WC763_01360 [Candidatus Paceibacterota bacterium]